MAQLYSHPDKPGRIFTADGADVTEAANMGAPEAFMWGVDKTGRNVARNLGIDVPASGAAGDASYPEIQAAHPVATGAGEIGSSMLPVPGGKVQTLRNIGGGVLSYLTGDPESSGVARTALGGLGQWGGDMAGRILSNLSLAVRESDKVPSAVPKTQAGKNLVKTGGKVTKGMDDNPLMRDIETYFERNLGSQRTASAVPRHNRQNTTDLAIRALGVDDSFKALDDAGLDEAESVIGKRFQAATDAIDTAELPTGLSDKLRRWAAKDEDTREAITDITGSAIPVKGSITLTGEGMKEMRSLLSAEIDGAKGARLMVRIKAMKELDETVLSNSSPDIADLYETARNQWELLKELKKGVSIDADGQLTPSAWNRIKDLRGKTPEIEDLRTNMRAGKSKGIVKPYGNSGTGQTLNRPMDLLRAPGNYLGSKAYYGGTNMNLMDLNMAPGRPRLGGGNMVRGLLSGQVDTTELEPLP